jgi:hypothetical protein
MIQRRTQNLDLQTENVLKRAEELIKSGEKKNALLQLQTVLINKKHKLWNSKIDSIMVKFIELAVELRKSSEIKSTLTQVKKF